MARRYIVALAVTLSAAALLIALGDAASGARPGMPATVSTPAPWPMFHLDAQHTGVQTGTANIITSTGPVVRWKFRVSDAAPVAAQTDLDNVYYRWTSTMPLADLDGDGTLEVVVTTPDGTSEPDRIIALKDDPGHTPPVRALWVYTSPFTYAFTDTRKGFDTYSPVLADADGDGLADVIFTTKDGWIRALKGTTGHELWAFNLERRTEDGPMLADLYGDGTRQVVITTDCGNLNSTFCPDPALQAKLYVLPLTATGTVTPLWTMSYPYKMDSSEPAIAAIDPDHPSRKAIVLGTWGGELLVAWQGAGGAIISRTLPLTMGTPFPYTYTPVIRTSPLMWDWGEGATAVFGWLPTDNEAGYARLSAVGIRADMINGAVTFTQRWTREDYDTWKSSPTLVPVSGAAPLIVMGYGLALPPASQSGTVGACYSESVFGGVVAYDYQGNVKWHHDFRAEGRVEGNVRASPAVAALDGDARSIVVLPVGCYGRLYAYDGAGGNAEWSMQLGPRSQGSPSIGDLDADGKLDIVLNSYDGYVWALSGGARTYLPLMRR